MYIDMAQLSKSNLFSIIGEWDPSRIEITGSHSLSHSNHGVLNVNKGHYLLELFYDKRTGFTYDFNPDVRGQIMYGYGVINSKAIEHIPIYVKVKISHCKVNGFMGPTGKIWFIKCAVDYIELLNSPVLNDFVSNDINIYLTNLSSFFTNILFSPILFDMNNTLRNIADILKLLKKRVICSFQLNKNNLNQKCYLIQDAASHYFDGLKYCNFAYKNIYRIDFCNIPLDKCRTYRDKTLKWFSLLNGHNEDCYKCIVQSGVNNQHRINMMYPSKMNVFHDDYKYFDDYLIFNRYNQFNIVKNIFNSLKEWIDKYNIIFPILKNLNFDNKGTIRQQLQNISVSVEEINDHILNKKEKARRGTKNKIRKVILSINKDCINRKLVIVLSIFLSIIHTYTFPNHLNGLFSTTHSNVKVTKLLDDIKIYNKRYQRILISNMDQLLNWRKNSKSIKIFLHKKAHFTNNIVSEIQKMINYLNQQKLGNKCIDSNLSINLDMFKSPVYEYIYYLRTNLSHSPSNKEIISLLNNPQQSNLILKGLKLMVRIKLLRSIGLNDMSVNLLTYDKMKKLIMMVVGMFGN